MNLAAKILALFTCVSLCMGGVILVKKDEAKANRDKTKVVPINNRSKQNRIWILV